MAAKPAEPEPVLVAVLRCYLDQRPEDAAARLRRYDPATQDMLQLLLPMAARVSAGSLKDPHEVGTMTAQLESIDRALQPSAELGLEKMCFCQRIERYGVYEPLPDDHAFRAGDLVQIYGEPKHFSCEFHEGAYITRLKSAVEIRDYLGHVVWKQAFQDRDRPDISHSCRHDYFNNYRFCVPDIPPGSYTVWVEVIDTPTKRTVRRSLDFRVVVGQ